MAGTSRATAKPAARKAQARSYTPPMSQGWKPLGFQHETALASLPGQAAVGRQDVRVPVASNQIFATRVGNWQGVQLRQFQSLLSRQYNISFAAGVMAEQKRRFPQLATNKTGTGLGLGKLKNLNVNAQPQFTNILARATAYGRYQNRVSTG